MDTTLNINDKIVITTKSGHIAQAFIIDANDSEIFVMYEGFGHLSYRFTDIAFIEKIISYSTGQQKVMIWENEAA